LKKIKLLAILLPLAGLFLSCPSSDGYFELPWYIPPGRTVSKEDALEHVYARVAVEVTSPQDLLRISRFRLNIGDLELGEPGFGTGPLFFDYVILSAARMIKTGSAEAGFQFALDTSELDYILNNRAAYIAPLQRQGVRVLLQVTNCRYRSGGFTFANLPLTLRYQLALKSNLVLVRYNLDGFEFIDKYGDNPELGLYAYPRITGRPTHYDAVFDHFPDHNPRRLLERFNISEVRIPKNLRINTFATPINWNELWEDLTEDERLMYFWLSGGHSYGNFLSYFRILEFWQDPDQSFTGVIGPFETHPIIVREAGFSSGRTNMSQLINGELFRYHQSRNSFMPMWIHDLTRPHMMFTSITDQVNYFLSDNLAPVFGWKHDCISQCVGLSCHPDYHGGEHCSGSGRSVMDYATNNIYGPGILDLYPGRITDEEIRIFSERFASGDLVYDPVSGQLRNLNNAFMPGMSFALLYYTNLTGPGPEIAERLSITSRIVYGGREVDFRGQLIGLRKDGPAVIYVD